MTIAVIELFLLRSQSAEPVNGQARQVPGPEQRGGADEDDDQAATQHESIHVGTEARRTHRHHVAAGEHCHQRCGPEYRGGQGDPNAPAGYLQFERPSGTI